MSKNALVIKDASFATNKLTTVSFGGGIPCTALSLSDESITFTSLSPYVLSATKTPTNTTDELLWSTSDANVAVVDNGTVTVKGLGTATITATCGLQTATCTVTISEITPNLDFGHFELASYDTTYLRSQSSETRFCIYDKNLDGSIPRGFRPGNNIEGAPIPLINNVGRIHVEATSIYSSYIVALFWCDTNTPASDDPNYNHCCYLRVDDESESYTGTSVSANYDVPTNAGTINAVAVMIRKLSADRGTGTDPYQFATTHGITLKFLPAAT